MLRSNKLLASICLLASVMTGQMMWANAFASEGRLFAPEPTICALDETWQRMKVTRNPESGYVRVVNGQLQLKAKIQFRLESPFEWTQQEVAKLPDELDATFAKVLEFYRDNEMALAIQYEMDMSAMEHAPPSQDSIVVYLRKTGNEMNAYQWALNFGFTRQQRSRVYAHEIGHWFGLRDEYAGAVGASELGEIDSVMRDWKHPLARFYPEHRQQIIANACFVRGATTGDRP